MDVLGLLRSLSLGVTQFHINKIQILVVLGLRLLGRQYLRLVLITKHVNPRCLALCKLVENKARIVCVVLLIKAA